MHTRLALTLAAAISLCPILSVEARPPYVARIPNGQRNACANCHINPRGGGARNAFGQAFGSQNHLWSAALAGADSDGDGATNGVELQDASGAWTQGNAAPGDPGLVTLPGDPASMPAPAVARPLQLVGIVVTLAEATGEQVIGIINPGGVPTDVAGYTLQAAGGSWVLPSGQLETVIPPQRVLRVFIDGTRPPGGPAHINEPAGEGLSALNAATDFVALSDASGAILDYVQWGAPGQALEAAAVQAGVWQAGDVVPESPAGTFLRHDAEGTGAAHWRVQSVGAN